MALTAPTRAQPSVASSPFRQRSGQEALAAHELGAQRSSQP